MASKVEMIGRRFGRILVIGDAEGSRAPCGKTRRNYRIRCDCGIEKDTDGSALRKGQTKSCGCLHREQLKYNGWKHGDAPNRGKISEYTSWRSMKKRCENPKAGNYERYGGRGITICKRWRDSYPAFLADMGRKPGPEYSIDRIDNDGNYEPGNCRWATTTEQGANKRRRRETTRPELDLAPAPSR